ncbi:MAG: hypothetical protein NUW23_04135 [Firmicutes bacterium]|jgi:hypothetical protein|nr:hypothetical protein [Bacillota bacterium]
MNWNSAWIRTSVAVLAAVAVALALAGLAGAAVYPYLPDSFNQPANLSVAEFAAVRLTAYYNCPGALTTKLMRQSVRCFLGPTSVDLFVDTLTQPTWDVYIAGTNFTVSDSEIAAAFEEAAAAPMTWLTRFFPGVPQESMRVIFSIKGFQVGIYQGGRFTLTR